MNRIGIILCGGVGSRLGQITKAIPKSLVPVYNKPLVDYQLELFEYLGIRDVIIITRPDTYDLFTNYLLSDSNWSERFDSVKILEQKTPGGIAQAYQIVHNHVPEGANTLLGLGDNIFYFTNEYEKEELKHWCDSNTNFITTITVKDPRPYGVVEFCKGTNVIKNVVEKPKDPPSNEIIPGLYFFDYSVFEKTKNLQPSSRGELEITDVQKLYINEDKLAAFKFKSVFWYDCGTVQDLLDANNFMHIMEDKQCKV